MAAPIVKIKRSSVPGKIPTPDQIPTGELGLNTFDGKLFASKNVGIGTTVFVVNSWTVGPGTNTYNTYFTEGNVGIGTTIPTSKLHIIGNSSFVGIVTATSFVRSGGTSTQFLKADGSVDSSTYLTTTGSGTNLTGIVTSIVAGTNITISGSTGQVTINATGGTASQWQTTAAGINTTSNVGIATATPTSKLHVIGDTLIVGVATATDFNSASDAKLKTNIRKIKNPIQKINQIDGVSFHWIENNKPSMGVIANQIEKVLPELVSNTDPKTVNYNGLIGLLIEVVKDQQKQIDDLRDTLETVHS